jgi:RNA polymerase sigma factor (sigma-70 family)
LGALLVLPDDRGTGKVTIDVDLAEEFEAARPRLLSLAHGMVGSRHDAEDAVQAAWLRTQTAGAEALENPAGWFTTVTARLCLDLLRRRQRRDEGPLLADAIPVDELAADEAFVRREQVSRALLVLLDQLTPNQRVAYVLHDLFAVPFEQVAIVLDTTPASAKKLASRARTRLQDPGPVRARAHRAHLELVEAFLAAARGGDLHRLLVLLAPDAVRTVDPRLVPEGAPAELRGAPAIAEETRFFLDRIEATVPMVIDGVPGAVIAPGGHLLAVMRFGVRDGVIASVEITVPAATPHLATPA